MMDFRTKFKWNGEKIKMNASRASEESIFELGVFAAKQAKGYAAKWYGLLAASINVQSRSRSWDIEAYSKYASGKPMPTNYRIDDKNFVNLAKPRSDRTVFVGTALVYAKAIEFGRGPYPIPKDPNSKVIMSDMTNIYWPFVHPGFTAKPYMRPAMDDAKAHAANILKPRFQNMDK